MALAKDLQSKNRIVWGIGLTWILFLGVSAWFSPLTFGFDAANGVLDLIHFKNGGNFQHHLVADPSAVDGFVEVKTTWWSPGQWFFGFILHSLGIPLGFAFSLLAIIAISIGILGWTIVYRAFQFNSHVIWLSILILAFSRFLYSQVMIYTGAAVLEFAVAPWIILMWYRATELKLLYRLILLFHLVITAYFVKSSLLILLLGLSLQSGYRVFLERSRLGLALAFPFTFFLGKVASDFLFVGSGSTPFDSPANWTHIMNQSVHETIQSILFILATPITSGIGADDYFNYVFRRPGAELLPPVSFGESFFLGCIVLIAAFLTWRIYAFKDSAPMKYKETLFFVGGVTIGFLVFAYFAGKPITVAEETRHARVFGLLFLPFVLQFLHAYLRGLVFLLPVFLCAYGIGSHMSKVNTNKLVIQDQKYALSEITDDDAWNQFEEFAALSNYYYVINGDWKFNKSQHNCFFAHDDFRSLSSIENRKDVLLSNESVSFLLPERFKSNGKREAILNNFLPVDTTFEKTILIDDFKEWEVIMLSVSKKKVH